MPLNASVAEYTFERVYESPDAEEMEVVDEGADAVTGDLTSGRGLPRGVRLESRFGTMQVQESQEASAKRSAVL